MKKKYQEPTVKVVELKQRAFLCTTSYDGYIPNMGNDELNKLA
jgi:hypothetical protein